MQENINTDDYDKDFDDILTELELADKEFEAIFSHIDDLISWHDFLLFEHDNLLNLERNLDAISRHAKKTLEVEEDGEKPFLIGVFWVGAISAYEGAMHELFLHTLHVAELRERIRRVCERRIRDDIHFRKQIKSSDLESIRDWLKGCTINDPAKTAARFDDYYDIETVRPDPEWCKQIIKVRNAYVHRNGGGVKVNESQLYGMIDELKKFASSFHEAFAAQAEKILAKEI